MPLKSLELKYWPDPVLRTKCIPAIWNQDEREFISNEMTQLMFEHNGYGLSAPQVGLDQRVFVMRDPEDENKALTFFNPIITRFGSKSNSDLEGCLSVPSQPIKIIRFTELELEFDQREGRSQVKLTGIYARCVQHEIDHLNGIMIFDHINSNLGRKIFLEKYMKKKNKRDRIM